MAPQLSSGDLLADRRYRYAEACLAEGDFAGAADLAAQTLERAPRYAPAWLLLGRARQGLAEGGDPALREAAAPAAAAAAAAEGGGRQAKARGNFLRRPRQYRARSTRAPATPRPADLTIIPGRPRTARRFRMCGGP